MKIINILFKKYSKFILNIFHYILDYIHFYRKSGKNINYLKYFGAISAVSLLVTFFVISGNSSDKVRKENDLLRSKLKAMVTQYKKLSERIDSVNYFNDQLRIAVNLEPISEAEKKLGIGGSKDIITSYTLNDNNINSAVKYVDELARKLEFEKNQYSLIINKFNNNKKEFDNIPAIRPIEGNYMTSGFGIRYHPILHMNKMHEGIDINAAVGTTVMASGNGTVVFTGVKGGYGNVIEIDHGYGYHTVYGHLSEILVSVGQKVKRREEIGKSGNTGMSTGPHLHYEVSYNGEKIDPLNFFLEDLNVF
ncbi:MAG: M23 family metallopeptidase [Bacteroidota bacterium]|nr:M23 family metallopeptidase [Bacteroidota bacterium]